MSVYEKTIKQPDLFNLAVLGPGYCRTQINPKKPLNIILPVHSTYISYVMKKVEQSLKQKIKNSLNKVFIASCNTKDKK